MVFLLNSLIGVNTLQAVDIAGSSLNNAAHKPLGVVYRLGDRGPQGGKVYYVDASGQHGLEAKATDEENSLNWYEAVKAAGGNGSGWRLPTSNELRVLYEQRKVVGGFASDDYWSATEQDINSAWVHGFAHGDQDRYNKYSSLRARAISAF